MSDRRIKNSFQHNNGLKKDVPVESLTIVPFNFNTILNTSFNLQGLVFPEEAIDRAVAWYSDNPEIATISRITGRVHTKSLGVATIKARCSNKVASTKITVVSHLFRFLLNQKAGKECYEDVIDGSVIKPFQDDKRLLDNDKCFEVIPFVNDGSSIHKMPVGQVDIDVFISNPKVLDYKKIYDGAQNGLRIMFACLDNGTTDVNIVIKEPSGYNCCVGYAVCFKVEINGMTGIILKNRVLDLYMGSTETIEARVVPASSDTNIRWSSSDSSLVTVKPDAFMNGMLIGNKNKKVGEAIVEAYTKISSLKAFISVYDIGFHVCTSGGHSYKPVHGEIRPLNGDFLVKDNSINLCPFIIYPINIKGININPIDFTESTIHYEVEKPELLNISLSSFFFSNVLFRGFSPTLKVEWKGKGSSDVTIAIKVPSPIKGEHLFKETLTLIIE